MSLKIASELSNAITTTLVTTCHVVTGTAKVAEVAIPQIAEASAFALHQAAIQTADALYDEEATNRITPLIDKFMHHS